MTTFGDDYAHETSYQQKKSTPQKLVSNASQRETGGVSKEFKSSVKQQVTTAESEEELQIPHLVTVTNWVMLCLIVEH